MPQKDRIRFSGTVSAEEAAQYLESLARGLRERTLLLESGDASIAVEVPADLKVEIQADSNAEKGKTDIEVSLGWRVAREAEIVPAPGLLIMAGAPAAEAASTFAE